MSDSPSWIRHIAITLALLIGVSSSAAAQWPAEVTPGARVQVRLPERQSQTGHPRGQLIRGRISSLASDTLYLAVTDSLGPLAIPWPFIQRMEVSKGVPSRGWSAVQRGLLGAVGTALTFYLISGIGDNSSSEDAAWVGAGVGLALGATFGALYPQERWRRVRSGF